MIIKYILDLDFMAMIRKFEFLSKVITECNCCYKLYRSFIDEVEHVKYANNYF